MEAPDIEFAKMDYARLGTQEQHLMSKRSEHWTKFFTIVSIPASAASVFGPASAICLTALVPFFLTCIALEIKHDEQVLRYDVRKQMKLLAAQWNFSNHDSKFSLQNEHQAKRFWHGYYKHGRLAAFIVAELIAAIIVMCSATNVVPVYGLLISAGLTLSNVFFVAFTAWCMR